MNVEQNNIFSKYNIICNGNKRYYEISFKDVLYDLECTSPKEFIYEDIIIKENSWTHLVVELAKILCKKYPNINFLEYTASWKKYNPFCDKKINKFYAEIDENIFLYRNFTSVHAFMLIRDMLTFCGLDLSKGYMIIFRTPYAEPKEVVQFIKEETELSFKLFMSNKYNFSEEKCNKIIQNINFVMNKILGQNVSESYDDWFMFSDMLTFHNYSQKFLIYLKEKISMTPHNIEIIERYLYYLKSFYTFYLQY